jgi:hypothetical protein
MTASKLLARRGTGASRRLFLAWFHQSAFLAALSVCAAPIQAIAAAADVSRALDLVQASIASARAGQYAEAHNALLQAQPIIASEGAAVATFQGEADGAFKRCVAAVGELDRKIGDIDTTKERVTNDIQTTETKLKVAVFNGDVAGNEITEMERTMAALISSLDARQAKLAELDEWSWVPGYGSYLGIRTLADKDIQEINRIARTLLEQQALKNASAERLRTAQAAWANLAAERSRLVAERSAAAAMRDNLDQRMKATRDATAFLVYAKEFWAYIGNFVNYQVSGAMSGADVMATALLDELAKPAPDAALVLGLGGEQANLRAQLIQLSGKLERGQGFAALAAADCAPRPGAAPIKACNITPTIPFYQITDFETCSFRYVNPPGCPPAVADHRPVAMTPQQEQDALSRMAKDQNWIALARCTSPAAIYLGQVPTEYECAAACLGAADCRFWTFNYKNRMMPGSVSECWGGTQNLAPETANWSGFISGNAR